jgi:hypothetical protein
LQVESELDPEIVKAVNSSLTAYYRCPDRFDHIRTMDGIPPASGYFRVGPEAICYGSYHRHQGSFRDVEALPDALTEAVIENGTVYLPFDPAQVIRNLGHEEYMGEWRTGLMSLATNMYYWLRPALSVGVRRHLQKFHLRGWDKRPFPRWPVDCSIDGLEENLMLLSLRASGARSIPFIWFWPHGHSSCAAMTHDVETQQGLDFCSMLMDIDDSFGIKASFQIIPLQRYKASPSLLEEIRERGFEICVHDLNHDGELYKNREQFLRRAAEINAYGEKVGAVGFRAAVLYRKQIWFDALKFAYDMSVPNVAHLDPQRGGCCTVLPYFLDGILEIPVTTIQDYSLFHVLGDYSISLWKQQTRMILAKHGLMSFIVHPDYVMNGPEQKVFKDLLGHLNQLRNKEGLWITTPGEINTWWRQRAAMRLVESNGGWRIEGEGNERACIAYASEEDGRLVLSLEDSRHPQPVVESDTERATLRT